MKTSGEKKLVILRFAQIVYMDLMQADKIDRSTPGFS